MARGDPWIGPQGAHPVETELPGIRRPPCPSRSASAQPAWPAAPTREAEGEHQEAGGDIGADHLREGQMLERGADQNGAGDGPEKRQRLTVGEAIGDADHAVDGERAEHPGGEIGLRQPALGAGRQDDGERPAGREQNPTSALATCTRARSRQKPRGAGSDFSAVIGWRAGLRAARCRASSMRRPRQAIAAARNAYPPPRSPELRSAASPASLPIREMSARMRPGGSSS